MGLRYLVEQNDECAAVLKPLLPSIGPLINDTSERVRAALAELALRLTKHKGLGWQAFLPPRAVVARLPHERAPMRMRLTRLLLPL